MQTIQLNTATQDELLHIFENRLNEQGFMQQDKELYRAVRHIMLLKGKRFRPLLLLQANDMFYGEMEAALSAAMAIEVFHNFSLVHDDIMDEASLRRGQPTVHEAYGTNNAIIAGDMMLCYAYQLLSESPTAVLPQLLELFNRTVIAIMEGQHLDMQFEQYDRVKEEDYLDMIEKKTSVLLAASLQMGAMVAGATEHDQTALYAFGRNLGLMFQIKDDLLDSFGNKAQVGKFIGGDIVQNKKTYLLVSAMNMANERQHEELKAIMALEAEAQKIPQMKSLFVETGAKRQAELKMSYYFEQAMEWLAQVGVEDERKDALRDLAESIYYRQH